LSDQLLQVAGEVTLALKAPRVNQGHAVSRFVKIGGARHAEKGAQVDPVLRPSAVVSGQQLQRQQVTRACDRHPKPGQDFQNLRRFGDLRLDPRRGKLHVENDAGLTLTRRKEARRR
jgi:hypothetical protein